MAALLQNRQKPLLIQLPNGQLVPAAGGALVDTGANAPIAAEADVSGALGPAMKAAGSGTPQIAGDDPTSNVLRLRTPHGGAASTTMLSTPRQPDPIVEGGGGSGGADIGALVKALGAAAGKGGSSPSPDTSSSSGVMDKIKSFLGIDQPKANLVPDDTAAPGNNMPMPVQQGALADINPDMPAAAQTQPSGALGPQINPGATPVSSAPPPTPAITRRDGSQMSLSRGSTGNNIAAANEPTGAFAGEDSKHGFLDGAFAGIIDKGAEASDPLVNTPEGKALMAARYGDNYKSPDWFDRLKANGGRMALLTGGLATMANASRPGATVGGAIGQGALSGIQSVYGEREAERAANRADLNEASQADLRSKQGDYYKTHGAVLQQKADSDDDYHGALGDAALIKADAATDTAAARGKSADAAMIRAKRAADGSANPTALMKNADFYVKNGMAKDTAEAVTLLRQAATDPGKRSSLVTARAKMILGSNPAPGPDDQQAALTQAQTQIDKEMSDAAPSRGRKGSGALADVAPGGRPRAVANDGGGALAAPKPGTVVSGYKFKGGDPHDPKNWEK